MGYLQRKADLFLQAWKRDPDRYPLIIKGARQVGKTETRRGSYFYFRTPPLRSAAGQSVMPGSTADQSVMPSSAARFASAAQMRSMPSKLFARSANTP